MKLRHIVFIILVSWSALWFLVRMWPGLPWKLPETEVVANLVGSELQVEWLGAPGIARPDDYWMNEGFITSVEIGLRSDGIVVWRAKSNE